eukprot:5113200-Pyramimonas_sp.AAC.2
MGVERGAEGNAFRPERGGGQEIVNSLSEGVDSPAEGMNSPAEGKYRSCVDPRQSQNPTKSKEYQKRL